MTKAKAITTIEYMLARNAYNNDQKQALEMSLEALKNESSPILQDDWYSYENE